MSDDSSDRIVAALRSVIASSAPGARLPSTRALVAAHHASPLTVQQALRTLAAEGLLESRPGAGTFVRAPRTARATDYSWQTAALGSPISTVRPPALSSREVPAGSIAWHSGYPDPELLPVRLVRAALARAARGAAAASVPAAAGLPELRAWFATELADVTPADVTPVTARDVVVLPGSQSGMTSILRALAGSGRPVIMESPTYWGATLAAAKVGVEVVPVPSGPDGPDPAALDRAFAETGARVFYAQPRFANPTGAQWTDATADAVLATVRGHGAFVVEDDWARDFALEGGRAPAFAPLAARDDAGHVVYLRSLTKSVSPALRVAALVARGPARDRILAERGADALYVSGILQAAALDVVTQPAWRTHLRAMHRQLATRRDLMVEMLHRHAPQARPVQVPSGGLNLWLSLPDGMDATAVARACEQDGLLLAAGDDWFPAEPSGAYLRANFAGPEPGAYAEGARVLGRVMDRMQGRAAG